MLTTVMTTATLIEIETVILTITTGIGTVNGMNGAGIIAAGMTPYTGATDPIPTVGTTHGVIGKVGAMAVERHSHPFDGSGSIVG